MLIYVDTTISMGKNADNENDWRVDDAHWRKADPQKKNSDPSGMAFYDPIKAESLNLFFSIFCLSVQCYKVLVAKNYVKIHVTMTPAGR